jgi:hypothetical protein
MAVRIIAGGFIMLAIVAACLLKPKPVSHPTKLEKTCFHEGAWLPCFIKDEALQTQWNI